MITARRTTLWLALMALLIATITTGVLGAPAPAAAAGRPTAAPQTATGVGAIAGSVLGINDDPTGVNAWDDPLGGVRVAVFDAATNAFVKATDTSTLGQYTITGLPAKAMKVRFTKSGWLTAWHSGSVTPAAGTTQNLGEDVIYAEAIVTGWVLVNFDPPPVNGWRITVFDAATGAVVAAKQLDWGHEFTIGGLPAGTFRLRATVEGYTPGWSGPFTLVAGEHAGIQPEVDGKLFLLEAHPEAVVQGTVVDAAGAALPGVRVLLTDAASGAALAAVNTDARGAYRIGRLRADGRLVKVRFSKAGYLTMALPGAIALPNENFWPAEPLDLGESALTAEAAVSGQVLSWMDPIGGARVTVFNATTGAVLAARQLTENEYEYRIGGLPAVPVKVRATKAGYITAWAGPYTLVAGQELKQSWGDPVVLYLDMAPAVVVQGTVTGANQAQGWTGPLAGVKVLLTDATTGKGVAAVTTDANGNYRFAALVPSQTVKVRFSKPGWLPVQHPSDIFLAPYSPIDLGTTTLQAAASVSGQVLSQMDPIGGARVTVFNATTGTVITAVNADGDGNYRIGGLPAGPVKVRATKDGYKDAWANYPATKATAQVYRLVSGQQLEQSWDPVQLYLDLMPQ